MERENMEIESSHDKQRLRSWSLSSSRGRCSFVTVEHVQCLIQLIIAIGVLLVAICGFKLINDGHGRGEVAPAASMSAASVQAKLGAPGPIGPPGPMGQQGTPGQMGPKGVQGDRGLNGADGAPGSAGVKGDVGLPGVPGRHGLPGIPGVKGDSGFPGLNGMGGRKGETGPPGISVLSGTNSSFVAFSLYRSSGRYNQAASRTTELLFDNVHFNLGSGLDVSTSVFTAPVRGVYFFTYCLRKDTGSDSDAYLMVNSIQILITDNDIDEADVKAISGLVTLEQDDRVWVQVASNSKIYCFSETNCRFDGYLLREF